MGKHSNYHKVITYISLYLLHIFETLPCTLRAFFATFPGVRLSTEKIMGPGAASHDSSRCSKQFSRQHDAYKYSTLVDTDVS